MSTPNPFTVTRRWHSGGEDYYEVTHEGKVIKVQTCEDLANLLYETYQLGAENGYEFAPLEDKP